uniref:Uncharacterized protein n=1 Tax=Panagrolaimus sp. PS1159 TaxID=55785 RepID=A0AC35FMC8_9BILA
MLASIWIDLLIFTCIAPLGPIIYTFHPLITGKFLPFCIMHLSYNVSFIIILSRKIYLHYSIKSNVLPTTNNKEYVVSPLGKNLPANVTFDSYFNELKKQWN